MFEPGSVVQIFVRAVPADPAATVVERRGGGVRGPQRILSVNGSSGGTLRLVRDQTYLFDILLPPGVAFHLSPGPVGGRGSVVLAHTFAPSINRTLVEFTPTNAHPDRFFYQCANSPFMGGTVLLTSAAHASSINQ